GGDKRQAHRRAEEFHKGGSGMKVLDVKQGTDAWHQERASRFTAREAPAMMGFSKYQTRSQLLAQKATGAKPEVTSSMQYIFDKGHEAEASAGFIAEKIIGAELYPCTATDDDGIYLASFDGITMDEQVIWEHKLMNEALACSVYAGIIPDTHWPQLEHQLMVSGAEKVLFMVSDGTEDNCVTTWYHSTPERRQALLSGWEQFANDLASYEHVEQDAAVVGEAVTTLPSVSAQVSGSLEIVDNLEVFETALRDFIDNRLITSPQTDQDFADLDSQIKTLERAEGALNAAEANVLSMVSAVDMFKRTKDMLHAMARDNRLMAQKLLKAEKENRRAEILQAAKTALTGHMAKVSATLNGIDLCSSSADFPAAMKGKRTITSLKDAADTELARAKIEANAAADKIRVNLELLRTDAAEYGFLFSDRQQLVTQESDHLKLIINDRIQAHKVAEETKLQAERELIRAEEKAKAEADAMPAPEPAKPQAEQKYTVHHVHTAAGRRPAAKLHPTDSEIIRVLCNHYGADEDTICTWLKNMDFSSSAA
ncbi:MAG TPA: YqaJ viral recombinase family protein, partial [Marinobacter sp.]|nr:YqaJ viral recombinase family protein [Marinobacter sp.]